MEGSAGSEPEEGPDAVDDVGGEGARRAVAEERFRDGSDLGPHAHGNDDSGGTTLGDD